MFCTVYSCIASYLNMHTATVAEMIVSQLFSGQTHAEETLAIAVDLIIPLVRVLKAPAMDKNLYETILRSQRTTRVGNHEIVLVFT